MLLYNLNTMKIRLLLFFLFLSTLQINAQLFWKVTGNGLTKPSYIFGTHHLIENEKIPQFDSILNIVHRVEAVVEEMDMSDLSGMQMKMMKAAMMKDTVISDLISQEDFSIADEEFKNVVGYDLKMMQNMKPLMLSTFYSGMLYLKINNLKNQPEAIDQIIQKKGRDENKKIIGLETVDDQINIIFNSIPLKRQAEIFVDEMKEREKTITDFDLLNSAYISGNLDKLKELSDNDDDMTADERIIMIDNRNNSWMKQFKSLFSENSCFVAVGCLHLVGENGLLNQLKNAGYNVEPVIFAR